MTILENFANYHVGAWFFGDGVTSRHIPPPEEKAKSEARKGKVAAVAAFSITALAVAASMNVGSAGVFADTFSVSAKKIRDGLAAGSPFAISTSKLISEYQSGIAMQVSPETRALAKRAIAEKVDFEKQSVEDWADKLLRSAR